MKYYILMGSPRKKGNTVAITMPFIEELERAGHTVKLVWLYDREIKPCIACRVCQKDWTIFGCAHQDDMAEIFDGIMDCDVVVLATPIYSWYCTPPMKAMLDRLVYGMNKYYGDERGPALWAGKSMALIITCGYKPEQGADLFAEGMKRYCKHSALLYEGMFAERDLGYKTVFMDDEKREHARAFARELDEKIKNR